MRAFVTGATGFIGGRVARRLRARGDDVVALVRTPTKAGPLRDLGCELVEGSLADDDAIRRGVEAVEVAFHVAADYRIGVRPDECRQLHEANVEGTRRVLDAAIAAGVPRIVHVSSTIVLGDTHGEIVDESYRRPPDEPIRSCYEETKILAHRAAEERIAEGAPIVIVQPGGPYGPGDTSLIATMIGLIRKGMLKLAAFGDTGYVLAHVDDIAEGIILAAERGRIGETYILGGDIGRVRDVVALAARLAGRAEPWANVPIGMVKLAAPLGPLVGRLFGMQPNFREIVRAFGGVTYWVNDEKARRELGYAPRDLETGLTQTLAGM